MWAIGMIAICVIAGRCPWKRASLKDKNFAAYVRDQSYLRTVFPISVEADEILRSIFTLREEECIDLLTLRERLTNIDTFYMSNAELETANSTVREIYESYEPRMCGADDTSLSGDSSSVYLSAASGESSYSQYSDAVEDYPVPQPDLDIEGQCSTFVNEADYDKIGGCDEVKTEGLAAALQAGAQGGDISSSAISLAVTKKDGSKFSIPVKHTLSKDQCAFILAGSALNLLAQKGKKS